MDATATLENPSGCGTAIAKVTVTVRIAVKPVIEVATTTPSWLPGRTCKSTLRYGTDR